MSNGGWKNMRMKGKRMFHERGKEGIVMASTQEKGKKKDNASIGDAGAHYIAFRLAAMGYAVGLTTHGTRAIDLVVANPGTGKSVTIQTKTMRNALYKQREGPCHHWWAGKPRQEHETFFYAFVDLREEQGEHTETPEKPKMPDVYIVPSDDVKSLLYPRQAERGWYAIEKEEDYKKYKEKWDAIESELE
jgi:hypothetical protein